MSIESPFLAVVESIDEALLAKLRRPSSRFVAGGTEVIADQNLGLSRPDGYVCLRRINALREIRAVPEGLHIGAGVVIAQLLSDPLCAPYTLLRRAARSLGTRQARNRATVGGNIASGDPSRTLPPCLLALEARVHLCSLEGERTLPIEEFLAGPGATALADNELVTGVTVPSVAGFQDYTMVGPRNAQFFATASTALVVDFERRKVRLGLGNVGPKALRASAAERYANMVIDWDRRRVDAAAANKFGELAGADCDPPSDAVSGADYRRHAIAVMAKRILARAFEEAAP